MVIDDLYPADLDLDLQAMPGNARVPANIYGECRSRLWPTMSNKQLDVLHDRYQVVLNLYRHCPRLACSLQTESCSVSRRSFHKVLADLATLCLDTQVVQNLLAFVTLERVSHSDNECIGSVNGIADIRRGLSHARRLCGRPSVSLYNRWTWEVGGGLQSGGSDRVVVAFEGAVTPFRCEGPWAKGVRDQKGRRGSDC
jgi:hypothetical protein